MKKRLLILSFIFVSILLININGILSDSCTMNAPFGCDDYKIDASGVSLVLRNGAGETVTVSAIFVSGCTVGPNVPLTMDDGTLSTYLFTECDGLNSGKRDIILIYTTASGTFSKTAMGTIVFQIPEKKSENNKIKNSPENPNEIEKGKYMPSACTINAPFGCDDHKINSTGVYLVLRNGAGESAIVSAMNVSGCTGGPTVPLTMVDGAATTYEFTGCAGATEGDLFIRNISITYTTSSGTFSKTTTGMVISPVTDKNFKEKKLKFLPETASIRARERLGELGFNITLKAVGNNKTIYEAKAKKQGKFLGFFKTEAEVSADIDTDTGVVIKTHKPWWSFLAGI